MDKKSGLKMISETGGVPEGFLKWMSWKEVDPTRIRQNWPEKRDCRTYAIGLSRPLKCDLPRECVYCQRWVCNACEKVVPWSNGGTDYVGLCDDCWYKYFGKED